MTNQILLFILWYLFIALFGFLISPLTMRLFKSIPDRGYCVLKVAGILAVAYLHWILTSAGLLQNSEAGIWSAILLAAVLVWVIAGRNGWKNTLDWMKEHRQTVIAAELLFFAGFSLMAFIRAHSPDIYGTEKPMELMFINSILASDSFPPQDAWLSGYGISYYYFGYIMVAMLAKITLTSGSIAFNLGISMTFALAASAVFGVVLNLIAHRKSQDSDAINGESLRKSTLPALLAPVFLLLVGNYYGLLEIFNQHHWFANTNGPAVWFDASGLDPYATGPQPSAIQSGARSFWDWLDIKQLGNPGGTPQPLTSLTQPNWFFASRTIQDRNLGGVSVELIDEFPAFSFLLADLHPHVLALPFVVLCVLLALEWFLAGKGEKGAESGFFSKARLERIGISALILGSLIFLNTWDFLIYVAVFMLAAFMQNFPLREAYDWNSFKSQFLKDVLPVIGLAVLLYLPFLISLQTQAGGILPNIVFPSRFRQVLVMFGPLMIPLTGFVLAYWIRHKKKFDFRFGWRFTLALFAAVLLVVFLLVWAALALPQASGLIASLVFPFSWQDATRLILQRWLVESGTLIYALLVLFFAAAFVWGSRSRNKNSSLFVFALIFIGALLLMGAELLYLRDQFGSRMNTVFKFYFQIWVLWSIASAYGVWFVSQRAQGALRWLWMAVMSIVVAAGLVYSIGTAKVITTNFSREPNLDGLAYFYLYYPQDADAIEWIKLNVPKDAVILEGTRGAYWIEGRSSRIAMATGIQTVMGWVNHESQWRGELFSLVAGRESDIQTMYTSNDWNQVAALLEQYDVDYVVVSAEERQWYGAVNSPLFDQMMSRVFESGDLVIYKTDR